MLAIGANKAFNLGVQMPSSALLLRAGSRECYVANKMKIGAFTSNSLSMLLVFVAPFLPVFIILALNPSCGEVRQSGLTCDIATFIEAKFSSIFIPVYVVLAAAFLLAKKYFYGMAACVVVTFLAIGRVLLAT